MLRVLKEIPPELKPKVLNAPALLHHSLDLSELVEKARRLGVLVRRLFAELVTPKVAKFNLQLVFFAFLPVRAAEDVVFVEWVCRPVPAAEKTFRHFGSSLLISKYSWKA